MTRLATTAVLIMVLGCSQDNSQAVTAPEQAAAPAVAKTVMAGGQETAIPANVESDQAVRPATSEPTPDPIQRQVAPMHKPVELVAAAPLLDKPTIDLESFWKLDFLPVDQVYKKSLPLDWHEFSYQFSEKGDLLYVFGASNRLYLCGTRNKQFIEYGTRPLQEMGELKATNHPAGYKYIQTPERGNANLAFVRDNRFYFAHQESGQFGIKKMESYDWFLKDKRQVDVPPFTTPEFDLRTSPYLLHVDRSGMIVVFNIGHDGSVLKYHSVPSQGGKVGPGRGGNAKPISLRGLVRTNWADVISPSLKVVAKHADGRYLIVTSQGMEPATVEMTLPTDEQQKREVVGHFFANNDKWFCILQKPDRQKTLMVIDYYDPATGNKLGRYEIPRTQVKSLDLARASLVQDRQGELLVFRENGYFQDRGNVYFFRVANDQFVSEADSLSSPELAKIGVPVALSPDGKQLACYAKPPEERSAKLAVFDMNYVHKIAEKAALDEMRDEVVPPKGNYLASLRAEDIDIELLKGSEPENLVHVITDTRDGATMFSPDDRWLAAASGSVLYDFATRTKYDVAQLLNDAIGDIRKIDAFAFSPDSRRMFIAIHKSLVVMDLEKRAPKILVVEMLDRDQGFIKAHQDSIQRLLFLPSDSTTPDTYHLIANTGKQIGMLRFDNQKVEQLDSRQSNMGHWFSYSADVRQLFLDTRQGTLKSFNLTGEMEATGILKFTHDPLPVDQFSNFSWLSTPFRFVVYEVNRNHYVSEFVDGKFSEPEKLPVGIFQVNAEGSRDWLEFKVNNSYRENAKVGLFNPSTRQYLEAEFPGIVRNDLNLADVASDLHHVAVQARNSRIWILRCNFQPPAE